MTSPLDRNTLKPVLAVRFEELGAVDRFELAGMIKHVSPDRNNAELITPTGISRVSR